MKWLRKFLRLAVKPSEAVVTGYRRPLGYQQLSAATLAASTGITIPTLPAGIRYGYAVIQCAGGTVRWRDDGTAPTSTVGMVIYDGGELNYVGEITAIRFILSATAPILDISLYE